MSHTFLKNIPDKMEHKSTTTLQFKEDLLEVFSDSMWKNEICIEIGTSQGYSAKFLSHLFKEVWTLEIDNWNIEQAKIHCEGLNNIHFVQGNAYSGTWDKHFSIKASVAFIDCVHLFDEVSFDINNAYNFMEGGSYLIFDDYGHTNSQVKPAVQSFISSGHLEHVCYIGKSPDSVIQLNRDPISDWEGIICKIVKRSET